MPSAERPPDTPCRTKRKTDMSAMLSAFARSTPWSFPTVGGGSRLIANLLAVAPSGTRLEARPLPSTGITRLQWYYGPFRLPLGSGPTLASVRLIVQNDRLSGSPVLPVNSPCRVPSPLPRWNRRGQVVLGLDDIGLPLSGGGSASTTSVFGACSTFTRVMARQLAELPRQPFDIEGSRPFVASRSTPTASWDTTVLQVRGSHPRESPQLSRRTPESRKPHIPHPLVTKARDRERVFFSSVAILRSRSVSISSTACFFRYGSLTRLRTIEMHLLAFFREHSQSSVAPTPEEPWRLLGMEALSRRRSSIRVL